MSLRPTELKQIADELNAHLLGATLQKAFVPIPRLAYIELRQPGRTVTLCLSAESELSRVSIVTTRLPNPGEPQALQRWLRQELIGLKLERVEPRGRGVELRFEKDGLARTLFMESQGGGLLVLTAQEGRVLALSGEGSKRGLHPGATFTPHVPQQSDVAEQTGAPSRLVPIANAAFPLSEAAEALYADTERLRRAEAIRRRLAQPHRARLGRLTRTLEKVRDEASREPQAEAHRRMGELMSQNLHRIPRGARVVTLTEYSERGAEEVVVKLDPKRGPKEEIAWHFHQYRRLLRGCEHAKHRLLELEREERTSRVALEQLEAMSPDALLAQLDVLAQPAPGAQPQEARPFREYTTTTGHRIWVGKNAEGNDTLTFKLARPHHLWLHARGVPGSHVVVPLQKNETLAQEVLLDAAHLALFHSDLKGEPRGEVSYVPVKYVRRVKGGAPGQVTFSQEKTFVVRTEPDRLKRLTDAQGT